MWELVSWSALVIGVCLLLLSVRYRTRHPTLCEVTTDLAVALTTGALVAVALFYASQRSEDERQAHAERLEDERAERDERRENLRFLRSLATSSLGAGEPSVSDGSEADQDAGASVLPLAYLDVRGQLLPGLVLDHPDLTGAKLTEGRLNYLDAYDATLLDADLTCADLIKVKFIGLSDLRRANFSSADLTDATFGQANLTGAVFGQVGGELYTYTEPTDLSGADLSQVRHLDLAEFGPIVWDEKTMWPEETPPDNVPPTSPASADDTPDQCTPLRFLRE